MNPEFFPGLDYREPQKTFPTMELLPKAVLKTESFIRSLYTGPLPESLDIRWNQLNDSNTPRIVIENNHKDLSIENDNTSRNIVGFYTFTDDNVHLPKFSTEPTIIHEILHFLSAKPDENKTGFYEENVLWKRYFNEAFTNLLTKYAYYKNNDLIHKYSLLDDYILGFDKKREEGIENPLKHDSESYVEANRLLSEYLNYASRESTTNILKQLTDYYFDTDFDKAKTILSSIVYEDFVNFPEVLDPLQIITLFSRIESSFTNLANRNLHLYHDILISSLLSNNFLNLNVQKENKILKEVIDLITLNADENHIKVVHRFSEFSPKGLGLTLDISNTIPQLYVNNNFLKLSRYAIGDTKNQSVLRLAYKTTLLQTAQLIHVHTKNITASSDVELFQHSQSKIDKLTDKNRRNFESIQKLLITDPSNPALEGLLNSIIRFDKNNYKELLYLCVKREKQEQKHKNDIYRIHIRKNAQEAKQIELKRDESLKGYDKRQHEIEKISRQYKKQQITEEQYNQKIIELGVKYNLDLENEFRDGDF